MTNFVAKSKLDAAEAEIDRLMAALRTIWVSLTNDCPKNALDICDEALNGPMP